jgi:hypothetical protein
LLNGEKEELKKQKKDNSVWVSRFWAQYNILPEPFKKGFFDLTQNIAKGAGGQGRKLGRELSPSDETGAKEPHPKEGIKNDRHHKR